MTPSELSNLTPEQKRVKIAEACGWTDIQRDCGRPNNGPIAALPDYLNSLDAMHEAEKELFSQCIIGEHDNLMSKYCDNLFKLCGLNKQKADHSVVTIWQAHCWAFFATATQRADAFLLTVG